MAKKRDDVVLRHLSWKEVGAIISIFTLLSGIVAWLHADVLIPTILRSTDKQIEDAIKDHVSASKEELQQTEKAIRSDVQHVKEAIGEFKADAKKRFDRIEDKLDRM